jgi:hypothetical protein
LSDVYGVVLNPNGPCKSTQYPPGRIVIPRTLTTINDRATGADRRVHFAGYLESRPIAHDQKHIARIYPVNRVPVRHTLQQSRVPEAEACDLLIKTGTVIADDIQSELRNRRARPVRDCLNRWDEITIVKVGCADV